MSRKKYVVDARSKINRRKARQQKAAENLQALIQQTPQEKFTPSFFETFENIMLSIDQFISQLAIQKSLKITDIKKFMTQKSGELKKLHKTLPSTATDTRRKLRRYEKMVLEFSDKLSQALEKNKKSITPDISPAKDTPAPSQLRM